MNDRLTSASNNNQAIRNDIGPSAIKDRFAPLVPRVASIEADIAITEGEVSQCENCRILLSRYFHKNFVKSTLFLLIHF